MIATAAPAGHPAFDVLRVGRRLAAELAGEAIDPATALTMADRLALATLALALAVDVEASRRAGVAPLDHEVRPMLAAALTDLERQSTVRRA